MVVINSYDVPQELIDGDARSNRALWAGLPDEVKAEVRKLKKHKCQLDWYYKNKSTALATNARYRSKKRAEMRGSAPATDGVVAEAVKEAVKPLKDRVAELEARLAELTERKGVVPMETIEEES
jgi:hypothetical protein